MKKFAFAALVAFSAAAFVSCEQGAPKANLKDDIDTLSYAVGESESNRMANLMQQLEIDSTYYDEFVKGVNAGVSAGDDKKKAAYYFGVQVGQYLVQEVKSSLNDQLFDGDSTKTVSMKNMVAGLVAGITGKKQLIPKEQAGDIVREKMSSVRRGLLMKEYGEYKAQNEKFLADNSKKEGVKTLPSGLQYKVLNEGNGAAIADTVRVKLHYEGRTIDGKVFDSSYEHDKPIEAMYGQLVRGFIPGFNEALTMMQVGSKWEVYIPENLAYGERAVGEDIKPFSTLIFVIEILGK